MDNTIMMRRLRKALLVFLLVIIAFVGYVVIVNRNSTNMTLRQKVLKAVYPVFMWWTKMRGKNTATIKNEQVQPPVSFYTLNATSINGVPFTFDKLRGKKVLLVNTASDCGYTDQYEGLQKLYELNSEKLVVIGFPANDFKEQEKGSDAEIESFCKLNYGVTFPLMKKSVVVKKAGQNPVFQWLTDSSLNGWNNKVPSWNFSKYLINEQGILTNYFGPSVSPLSEEVVMEIKK